MNNLGITSALFLAVSLLFTSCTKDFLRGEGSVITETRTPGAFTQVEFSGIRQAEIIRGPEHRVELNGYASLIAQFRSEVSGNRLQFGYPNGTQVRNDNIRIKVYTPSMEEIHLSGDVEVIMGSGFDPADLRLFLSGLCRVDLGVNQIGKLLIDGSGKTRIKARLAPAADAEVRVSGDTEADITATQRLRVDASGRTLVRYWGQPTTVDVNTSGQARVVRQQ